MSRRDENLVIALIIICFAGLWFVIKLSARIVGSIWVYLDNWSKETLANQATDNAPKPTSVDASQPTGLDVLIAFNQQKNGATPAAKPTSSASANNNQAQKFKIELIGDVNDNSQAFEIDMQIDETWTRADFDYARLKLQKVSYGMVGDDVADVDKENFKRFMTQFAEVDPLYNELISKVKPLLEQTKRLTQSTIYKHLPEYDPEEIRYVLYFAHEIGDIYRVKKGRSYEITLIGKTINQAS